MDSFDRVMYFFEELSCIPRESGDEKAVSDYLLEFAKQRNLEAYRDEKYNVIIKKLATAKNCSCPPVIIQGHTDMVYVRDPDCKVPYEEGIKLVYKDGWISAEGTTLGADDGIAVAFALAVLDSDEIEHPDIEAVFTVSEEIGLLGAEALDCGRLKGKYLINLDTEEEGILFTSCAGAFRNELIVPIEREKLLGTQSYSLKISGLYGGHSGAEIHQGRGNAITIMGRVLAVLGKTVRVYSISAEGKMNAICNNCAAELCVVQDVHREVEDKIKELEADIQKELGERDTVILTLSRSEAINEMCYTEKSQKVVTSVLNLIPNGVIGMSYNMPDLVETSANPGIVEQKDNELLIMSSCRSSVGSRKLEMREHYAAIAELCGGESICSGDYPQWEYKSNSPLRKLAAESYKELFGCDAKEMAIHAGLECGFFSERLPEVDIISYGPNLIDIHTPKERAEIKSIERVWQLTKTILDKLAKR